MRQYASFTRPDDNEGGCRVRNDEPKGEARDEQPHRLSNFVIEVKEDRASAASYVHVVLAFAHDPTNWVDSVGRYDDMLVRTTDGWRIAARRVTMTRTTTGSG